MASRMLLAITMIICLGNTNCGPPSLNVKLYRMNHERGGLYRGQDDELIPYPQADGYYCMNQDDMRKVVQFIAGCRND